MVSAQYHSWSWKHGHWKRLESSPGLWAWAAASTKHTVSWGVQHHPPKTTGALVLRSSSETRKPEFQKRG